MDVVKLDLGKDSYSIYIAAGLMDDEKLLRSTIKGRKVFIVTCETVGSLYLEKLKKVFDGFEIDSVSLPDGERSKTLQNLEFIVGEMLAGKHNRGTTIIALGGGVVGDLAGFVAATYQRGVDFVQIPTSLLAQVDSSVGGKTAVNHRLGKNMIGAFYQPQAVYIDTDTLMTLPRKELSAGFAEVIKHGILADSEFFSWLEDHVVELLRLDKKAIGHAVKRSCEIKAAVVAIDEKEKGTRALLNLGHTFGHAIEIAEGYGNWLHGEAVAVGIVLAADLSMRMGKITGGEALRIKSLIRKFELPVGPPPTIPNEQFIELMNLDKKTTDTGVRYILLEEIGRAVIEDNIDPDLLFVTLDAGSRLCET